MFVCLAVSGITAKVIGQFHWNLLFQQHAPVIICSHLVPPTWYQFVSCRAQNQQKITRSSAVAERPCDASCHWIINHSRSLKFIETSTIRKVGYGFLFAFYSNYRSILYHFRDKATCWSKIAIFFHTPGFGAAVCGVIVGILPHCSVWKNLNGVATRRRKKVWGYV